MSANRYRECHEAVTRKGIDQPCERTAVALRIDPEDGHPYPVCARHARDGDSSMVPLADVLIRERAETAEQIAQAIEDGWRVKRSGPAATAIYQRAADIARQGGTP